MNNKIIFPRAFAFAIDDMGWNEGSDISRNIPSGPYRCGVKRKFTIEDYKHIVAVAKAVGVRIQGSFILSEMDRENVLAKFPSTTYLKEHWDNSKNVCDEQLHIMKYVQEQSAFLEFGLHGVGHEQWDDDGNLKRAEWYNRTDKHPWPVENILEHINAFKAIMAQYDITPENGHSFPESFVPCSYAYHWNPNGDYSTGKLLGAAGIKYTNTNFSQIPEQSPPAESNGGGFDNGVHVINRMNFGNHWFELNTLPKVPLYYQETDMIESHWPNWLAQDDFLQKDTTASWIQYYKEVQNSPDRYIAKNTEQLHSQWLYNKYTLISETTPGYVEIDNSNMPEEAYQNNILGNMVLKIALQENEHISSASINGNLLPAYFEDEGFAFLYLPILGKGKHKIEYTIGNKVMPLHVFNDGTYNVYGLAKTGNTISLLIKLYGKQTVKIKCAKPLNVTAVTNGLMIDEFGYDNATGLLHINATAKNMQGTNGEIKIMY